jgi:hypothetical protein
MSRAVRNDDGGLLMSTRQQAQSPRGQREQQRFQPREADDESRLLGLDVAQMQWREQTKGGERSVDCGVEGQLAGYFVAEATCVGVSQKPCNETKKKLPHPS